MKKQLFFLFITIASPSFGMLTTAPLVCQEEKELKAWLRARELGLTATTNIEQKAREILDQQKIECFLKMYDELENSYASSKKNFKILAGSTAMAAGTLIYLTHFFRGTTAEEVSLTTTGTFSGLGIVGSLAELHDQNFMGKWYHYYCKDHSRLTPGVARHLKDTIIQKRKKEEHTYITKHIIHRLETLAAQNKPLHEYYDSGELDTTKDFVSRLKSWYLYYESLHAHIH